MKNLIVIVSVIFALSSAFAQEKKDESPIKATFKDGLKLFTEDGNFEMHIGGRYIGIGRFRSGSFEDTGRNYDETDVIETQESRLEASGSFYKDFTFKVQYDFGRGYYTNNALKDGWVGFERYKEFKIKIGQFKQPFGMEQLTSRRFIDTIERTNIDNLTPSREFGIMLHGQIIEKILNYQASVSTGAGANTNDKDDQKDINLRVVLNPFANADIDILKKLHLGLATTQGRRSGDDNDASDIKTKDTNTKIVDFDTGVDYHGDYDRLGAEVAWLYGPGSVKFEYIQSKFDLKESSVKETGLKNDGFSVIATCWITGDEAIFMKRPKVKKRLLEDGGTGAWQVVAKYQQFNVDDDIITKNFASSAGTIEEATGWTVGVNFWPIPNVRFSINYLTEEYDNNLGYLTFGTKRVDDEQAVLLRFQVDF